jgi:hypothetical protein
MAVRYTYLALEEDHKLVADWFLALAEGKTINDRDDRLLFYFRAMTARPLLVEDKIDPEKTPLVLITKPRKIRGTLWTDAEVLFTPTPLRSQFPALQKISQAFAKWLKQYDLVFSRKNAAQSECEYWLEAGIQNFDAELYALPRALAALRAGQYFVHHRATSGQLDTLTSSLKLRGYYVEPA